MSGPELQCHEGETVVRLIDYDRMVEQRDFLIKRLALIHEKVSGFIDPGWEQMDELPELIKEILDLTRPWR